MRCAVFILLVGGLQACGGSGRRDESGLRTQAPVGSRGAPIELPVTPAFAEVARLEDARSLGNGRLLEVLARGDDARLRARAALALGRFPFPAFGSEVTEALVRALQDPTDDVRASAAFALGIRGDPAGAGALLAFASEAEAPLRAVLVDAASRLPDTTIHPQLALMLRDADLAVRMAAAVGTSRWDPTESGAAEVDRALLDALLPYRITREAAPKSAVEAELVWRILWALGRRKAELGRGPFLEYASSAVPLERLFALRGLAKLPPSVSSVRAALAALDGPLATRDWRVAHEAVVALGSFATAATDDAEAKKLLAGELPLVALEAAALFPNPHVRAAAMEATAGFGDGRRVLEILQRGRLDLSATVRAATLRARVRLGVGDDALEALVRGAQEDDPILRAAAADAAGDLDDPRAAEVLLTLARDPALFVATRAVEKLGQHPSEATRRALHAALAHADNGIRLAGVLALEDMPAPEDVEPILRALETARGDGSAELAFTALELLRAIGGAQAQTAIERAQSDPRPHVRAVAKRLVRELGFVPEVSEPPFTVDRAVPLPGTDYPAWRFNPLVELTTTRGVLTFELFPAEAPVHVHNFLSLIRAKHYDGLTFHRVVPSFVAQGGDYRGDGNGAKPWAGEALRAEFTPRRSARGSLGMPRNDDPDSGGSQFFVTHLPTPHLDGRFTFFGELRGGGEVLDQLEVGDRILSARVLE
jgi:cyclophilin family peptidyl-prolyl cis-trans isomerase/HEAT repeat protein